MFSFNLVRWVQGLWRRRRGKTIVNKRPRYRLAVEELETRLAPAQFIWTGAAGNTAWSNAGNWLGGIAPSAASTLADLVFDSRGSGALTSNNNIAGMVVN